MDNIRLRTKLIFWLLLGFLSVATAEVTVSSAPFAFINPVETVFLTLFYGSHLLLFAWLAFRRGWPSLATLWLAGVLFGLYEFYITKVLWAPPWGDTISVGHIDLVALIVLAFFWHPFMAFIFPLAIGERIGTTSQGIRSQLPRWLIEPSRRRRILIFTIAALTHGMIIRSSGVVLVPTASAVLAVTAVAWWWRRGGRNRVWTLRSLLPSDRQGRGIAVLVGFWYVTFIPLWNPGLMPPLLAHVIVWLLYAGFAVLFTTSRRATTALEQAGPRPAWPRRRVIQWVGSLLILSLLGSLGRPEVGVVVVWGIATVAGLRMLIGTLRSALRVTATEEPPASRDDDRAHT
ncbi:MAG: hypothetical protein QNJ89_02510 [Acidimicrobiia bacterium]|nr:hypothetical protein [Acidimicrobiia bacterium]